MRRLDLARVREKNDRLWSCRHECESRWSTHIMKNSLAERLLKLAAKLYYYASKEGNHPVSKETAFQRMKAVAKSDEDLEF